MHSPLTPAFHSTNISARYTVKQKGEKTPTNAGNFTGGLHIKRPHTQFRCVTCSLLVKTGKFTRVCAASTSHRIHANCLQLRVNLPEYNGYFTGNFTCGTHANCPQLACKYACFWKQKYTQFAGKTPAIAGKKTCSCRQNYPQLQVS